jgi:hypothetical protein
MDKKNYRSSIENGSHLFSSAVLFKVDFCAERDVNALAHHKTPVLDVQVPYHAEVLPLNACDGIDTVRRIGLIIIDKM